jgi:DsbC/DsbD-like thiol-disulfide interchange protein
MFRARWFMRSASVAVLLVAAFSTRATAQRGSLTATLTGHRTRPASDTLALRIAVQMTPGWHVGAGRPGGIGVPTELTWRLPTGWRVLTTRWAAPTSRISGRDTLFEYHGPFAIEATLVTGGRKRSGPIKADLSYGICRDVCIPGRLTLTHEVR